MWRMATSLGISASEQATFSFHEGNKLFPDAWGNNHWQGYRSAHMMQIFRTVFGTDSGTDKWSGQLNEQAVSPGNSEAALTGVDYLVDKEAPKGTTVAKLFSYLSIAPYPGSFVNNAAEATEVTGVDTSTNTITVAGVNSSTFRDVTFTSSRDLPAPLQPETIYVLRGTGTNTARITPSDVNSTSIDLTTAGSGTINSYSNPTHYWITEWMRIGQEMLNQKLGQKTMDLDYDRSYGWGGLGLYRYYWLLQKTLAESYDLQLSMYEGSNNWVRTSDNGDMTKALDRFSISNEAAAINRLLFDTWLADGGVMPNKYNDIYSAAPWGSTPDVQFQTPTWLGVQTWSTQKGPRSRLDQ